MEVADGGFGYSLPNQPWHQHQLVVVDPDDVAGLIFGYDCIGEPAIDRFVEIEILDLQRQLANEIVKQRPQDAVTKPIVIALDLARAELDGADVELAIAARELRRLRVGNALAVSGPTDPKSASVLVDSRQAGCQPSGAGFDA